MKDEIKSGLSKADKSLGHGEYEELNLTLRTRSSKIHIFRFGLVLILALFIQSCVPENQGTGRRTANTEGAQGPDETTEPDSPDFQNQANTIQAAGQQSSSNLSVSTDYEDSFYVRGAQVNYFIKSQAQDEVQCLVAHFPNSSQNKIAVFAATPRFFVNFSTNTREYYYYINPSSSSDNQALCQKTGLINQIDIQFGSSQIAYALNSICSSCSSSDLRSNGLSLYNPSGAPLSAVDINYIRLSLISDSQDNAPIGSSCEESSECKAKGFDCCSSGQCVKDKQLKSGVDTSHPSYLQALEDIQQNPARITNYPQYFHLCSAAPPSEPTDPDPIDPELEAQERLTRLQELHECTTLQEGEVSICTKTIENASQQAGPFFTTTDDRNFNSTYRGSVGLLAHSIVRIEYAGEVLFDDELGISLQNATIGPSNSQIGNDNLGDALEFDITQDPPDDAQDDTLKVKYKIDGSCERISSNLAQCKKFYVQGQNLGRVDDHFPARNQFDLPNYADINRSIIVRVNDAIQNRSTDWELQTSSNSYVEFIGSGLQVFDGEKIEISYFVNLDTNNALLSKEDAISKIQNICECVGPECRLDPILSEQTGDISDFKCVYPQPDLPPPPAQQTVMLSSKSTPHRYFDQDGLHHTEIKVDTPKQEGEEFFYEDNDPLKPNNLNESKGFNEIYGSYSAKPGSAMPAKEVRVEKGKTYDIFTESGSFSSCLSCGNDYHSTLARLFPESFNQPGAGYQPNLTRTNRSEARDFRSDDLIFGRSCFVPATMIPWSHSPQTTRQQQRLSRLATQHFYFSNGYQRDWFGFNYGSVIGSFDGVNWFSVGTQRRVKATTNKLYLAINAYFGDQTSTSNYSIFVGDASTSPDSGSTVTDDFDSDGATCRQVHSCQTDTDCATKLGWDYTCQDIGNLTTSWPEFDSNASEIPGESRVTRLKTLFNIRKGGNRRCVYRGRGTPCQTTNLIDDPALSFNSSTNPGMLACSSNNYCQPFVSGSEAPRFNNKIARFARSVRNQNASSDVPEADLDSFGKGARTIGRPYEYNGTQTIPNDVIGNMSLNSVPAMCIPGRNPQSPTLAQQHNSPATLQNNGDRVLGIGVTLSGQSSLNYTSACSIFDTDGNYYSFNKANLESVTDGTPNSSRLRALAAEQVLPTNALKIFEGMTGDELLKNFNAQQVDELTLEENRCLRAPGSVCHTDLDCAPSRYITNVTRLVDTDNESILEDTLNLYEILFWQEPLVCGQEVDKDHEDYDLTKNRCCLPTGTELRIGSEILNPDNIDYGSPLSHKEAPRFTQDRMTGIDINLNSELRNSRLAPVHAAREEEPSRYPPLQTARDNTCALVSAPDCREEKSLLNLQFNTLDKMASAGSCSNNWIRHWHPEENGGGHRWESNKVQNVDKTNFECKNWISAARTCESSERPDDPSCDARSVLNFEADAVLDWVSKFELLGIPQASIESDSAEFPDLFCEDSSGDFLPGFVVPGSSLRGEYFEENGSDPDKVYLSATNEANFNPDFKKIFSEDEFSSCLPAGTEVTDSTDRDECCTGFINQSVSPARCALPDYTNVSLYTNRYVSSEANHLDDSVFDDNGFIDDAFIVEQLACQQKICASGRVMRGVLYSPLKRRGHENSENTFPRFLDGNDESNNFSGLADIFDAGARWNNHVYCAPPDIDQEETSLFVFQCP